MTVKANTFEGGTAGAGVTTGNSGGASGDAASALYIGATSIVRFSSTSPMFGTMSIEFVMASGETAIWEWTGFNTGGSGLTHIGWRKSFTTPASFGAITDIMGVRSATGKAATCKLTAGGKIATYDAGDVTALYTTGVTLTVSTEYDLGMWVENGTTTANGKIHTAIYNKGSSTPLETMYSTTAANTGTTILTTVRSGKMSPSTLTGTLREDAYKAGDSYTDIPTISVAGPTGTAVTSSGVVVVNASSYIPGAGGGLTFAMANLSGPTLTYSTLDGWIFVFTPHATTDAVYRLTVSEAGGGSTTQDITIPASATTTVTTGFVRERVLVGGVLV